jgi:hypothetical protein
MAIGMQPPSIGCTEQRVAVTHSAACTSLVTKRFQLFTTP